MSFTYPGADEPARAAGTDEVVADLPRGWETMLDRRFKDSPELSGGQWQRLAQHPADRRARRGSRHSRLFGGQSVRSRL